MDLYACRLVLASGTLTQVFLPLLPLASTLWDFCNGVHRPIFILFFKLQAKHQLRKVEQIVIYSNAMLCGLVGSLQIHFH